MELLGAIFIIAFGTLGHFIFEWSGHRKCAGIFFAVNESTWEHIKLAIYPNLIWGVVEGCVRGFSPLLAVSVATSLAISMVLIPALFYGYTAIVGKNFLITDILCFVLAVSAGMWAFHFLYRIDLTVPQPLLITSLALLALIVLAYLLFSYNPPRNFLFRDPITHGFGPLGHDCDADFHNAGEYRKHQHQHHDHKH